MLYVFRAVKIGKSLQLIKHEDTTKQKSCKNSFPGVMVPLCIIKPPEYSLKPRLKAYFLSVFDSNFLIASLINWYEMTISTGQLSIQIIGSVYIFQ
jgi:hypothetical protein